MNILARRVSALAARSIFLSGLFVAVVLAQVAVTSAFIHVGLGGGPALLASGTVICAVVAVTVFALNRRLRARVDGLEAARVRLGLPDGPCCVVWRGAADVAMPWTLAHPIEARFPPVARSLGVEGLAIVEFEIGADGVPKAIHCIDVWPAPVFYEAAAAALAAARFTPIPGAAPRFGASYQVPFVFRIRGAAAVRDRGEQARPGPRNAS